MTPPAILKRLWAEQWDIPTDKTRFFPVGPARKPLTIPGAPYPAAGYVYYARVSTAEGPLYKIGITKRASLRYRFPSSEFKKIKPLAMWHHRYWLQAKHHEDAILREFSEFKYSGPPVLKSKGNSELFTRDVLGLDDVAH